ncbi:leucine-rich repeat protein [bacterium]|nr:leucine-rich repeat protein [bacterium]
MKKLPYLLALIFIFFLVSCGTFTTKAPFTTREKHHSTLTTDDNTDITTKDGDTNTKEKTYVNVMIESGDGFNVIGNQLQRVEVGTDCIFNLEILEGYHYISNNSNGTFEDGVLTIKNINTPRVVVVTCEKDTHIIKLKAQEGLIIYDGDTVVENDKTESFFYNSDVTFKIGFVENYEYRGVNIVSVDGKTYEYTLTDNLLTVKNVKSDSEIMVQLRYVSPVISETYQVTLLEDEAFTIVGDSVKEVSKGESVSFNITLNAGYYYLANNCGATYNSGTIILDDVNGNQNIVLTFGKTSTTTTYFDNGKMELYDGPTKYIYRAYPDTGYSFISWNLGDEIYSYAKYLSLSKDEYEKLELNPVFAKISDVRIVKYNSNGGKIYNSSDYEVSYAFSNPIYKYPSAFGEWCHKTFYRDGYVPIEYNTMPDGSGEVYSLGSKILNDDPNLVLYVIWEKETNPNDFEYTYNKDDENNNISVTLNKYIGSEKNIVIPTTINNLKVEYISSNCFTEKDIEKVVITKNIIEVSKNAFKDCTHLETIYLSDSVNRIWDESFINCTNLKNLRMIATLPPCYSDHIIAITARRFEYLYQHRNTEKHYIIFYGGSSIFQGFDGATMQSLFDTSRYQILNGGQNAYVPGKLMMELYSYYMKADDIMVFAPEYSPTLFSDNFELPTWVALESYYDFLRYIDIRNYSRVFDSIYDFMNGSEDYTISPKLQMMSDNKAGTYDVYLDVADEYFTRKSDFDFTKKTIYTQPLPVDYEKIENGLKNSINVLYSEVYEPRGIRFYMASVTMWEEAFPGEPTQYQDFVDRIKEYILFPYISNVANHLVDYDSITDSISHLTPQAAITNSNLLAQEIKYQMHLDGIF